MKRQGASSERKRARMPSGKAGAEGGGEGALGPVRSEGRACEGSDRWISGEFLGLVSPAAHSPLRGTFS